MNVWQIITRGRTSIRASLGWVLAGTLLCGLFIASYFSWSFITLERMQYEVSSQSLALRKLDRLSEQLDLLLVSADLAIGAGETYTAQIALSLTGGLTQQILEIGGDDTLPYDKRQLDRFELLLGKLRQQIKAREEIELEGSADGMTSLLKMFDDTSGEIVTIFENLSETAQSYASNKSIHLAERRAGSAREYSIALIIYFLANAVIIFWAFRRIAWPLEELTRKVDTAMESGSALQTSLKGPLELTRLARHFARLVAQLEQKVAERTIELLSKTERLEQEIAERTAVQVALESAKNLAEKSSKIKSEFLSVMSHELRTPMNAVLGSLSLIRSSGITEEQREYVDIADESGKALVDLLGDILDLSKIESEELNLKHEPFSVYEVLSTTVNMLQRRAVEKGLRMSAVIDPDVPAMLIGDFTRVRQVLINLVGNAIKFTEEGFIKIHLSSDSHDSPEGAVRFSVIDSGIGVEQCTQEDIFDSFTQVDSSMTREHSGVGLGLAICSKLAHAMGGSCGLEAASGSGSTFWFTVALPTRDDIADSNNGFVSVPPDPEPVLVVADIDAFAAEWLCKILKIYGVPFSTVGSGKEATAKFKSAAAGKNPYVCLIVPARNFGHLASTSLRQMASSIREPGGRFIVLSDTKETLISDMIEEGLIDAWHCGTICQYHLIKTILRKQRTATPLAESSSTPVGDRLLRNGSTRILIVEDSRANRLIATAILQNAGFQVDGAGSGTEAIEKFQQTDFDLVLMDLQMSEMDGFETTREIRSLPTESCGTPIIAFSANVMEETRNRCMEAGMNDFISKPLVKETLLERITYWTADRKNKVGAF